MNTCKLEDGQLVLKGQVLLTHMDPDVEMVSDDQRTGCFLLCRSKEMRSYHAVTLGRLPSEVTFAGCSRYDPYWVEPFVTGICDEIPYETQFLCGSLANGSYLVLLPILDGNFRCSLHGRKDGCLGAIAESGDPAVLTDRFVACYAGVGDNLYRLIADAAQSVACFMGSVRLRKQKTLPDFIDFLGWCTWDAFYEKVNYDSVREGLQALRKNGINPGFMILDDGWLHTCVAERGSRRLCSFDPDPGKFPTGLRHTVSMAKTEFGIRHFLVWHTLQGYWDGINGAAFGAYRTSLQRRTYGQEMVLRSPDINDTSVLVEVIAPEDLPRFYGDFYRFLRQQGVDGVKVDGQATQEGVAKGLGGRVRMMRAAHEAMEGAAQVHFSGRVINCMSHGTDTIYNTLASTLTRSFTDFWPKQPHSHGLHIYANAFNNLWLGQFVHPDWDMFQSTHELAAFHAAGRAISGGPVYISDKPGHHNAELLRKLVLKDGTILRACGVGLPTADCIFTDPRRCDVLLKIFNHNPFGGVVGVFNVQYHPNDIDRPPLQGNVCPRDVEGLPGEVFALYSHNTGRVITGRIDAKLTLTLGEGGFDIITVAPYDHWVAPFGLCDRFNSGAAIKGLSFDPTGRCTISLRDGGIFVACCKQKPLSVCANGIPADFSYVPETGLLQVCLAEGIEYNLTIAGESDE